MPVDERGHLQTDVFPYRAHKSGAVALFYKGCQVVVVRGRAAEKLLRRTEVLEGPALQLELANAPGIFKYGNER